MAEKSQGKRYSKEQRLEAIKLIAGGMGRKEAAEKLGVPYWRVSEWAHKAGMQTYRKRGKSKPRVIRPERSTSVMSKRAFEGPYKAITAIVTDKAYTNDQRIRMIEALLNA